MSYAVIEEEYHKDLLFSKGRPRLVTCVGFVVGAMLITATAIGVGIIIGYTFCYLEYKSGLRSGIAANITEATKIVRIMQLSQPDSPNSGNNTINEALMSSVLITRIVTFGQALMKQEDNFIAWVNKKPDIE